MQRLGCAGDAKGDLDPSAKRAGEMPSQAASRQATSQALARNQFCAGAVSSPWTQQALQTSERMVCKAPAEDPKTMGEAKNSKAKQRKVDTSLDMTFPASDPPASGRSTGTEPPARPSSRQAPRSSRQAPRTSKAEIEAAAGSGRKPKAEARKRHLAFGRSGLRRSHDVDDSAEAEGLGGKGRDCPLPCRSLLPINDGPAPRRPAVAQPLSAAPQPGAVTSTLWWWHNPRLASQWLALISTEPRRGRGTVALVCALLATVKLRSLPEGARSCAPSARSSPCLALPRFSSASPL